MKVSVKLRGLHAQTYFNFNLFKFLMCMRVRVPTLAYVPLNFGVKF